MEAGDSEAAQKLFSSLFFKTENIHPVSRGAIHRHLTAMEEKSGDVHIEKCSSVQ